MNILHCYAQQEWHDDVYISGDESSLRLLRECRDYVVEARKVATCDGRLEYKGRAEDDLLSRIDAAIAGERREK